MGEHAYNSINELKKNSIYVEPYMPIVCSQIKAVITLGYHWVKSLNGLYAVRNNKTVAFIHENKMFVTPYSEKVLRVLQEANFSEGTFMVPLSSSDYPAEGVARERWHNMLATVK